MRTPAVANYTFDNANRLAQITQGSTGVLFSYDNANRRTTLTLPNGVVIGYSYDGASQLVGLTYQNNSTTLGNLTYSYDLAGRRVTTGGSYARTGLPPALSATAYNVNNQLTSWGGTILSYDLNGSMTSDGAHAYSWDARNRLSQIDAGTTASFVYDAFGRRATKTIGGTGTSFLYDGANAVQELSGTTPTANLLSGGLDEVFQRTDSAGARSFLTDALGSTLALTDSTGTLQTRYTFEPFGNTTQTCSATSNSLAYTGRELDATGLYFYRARYYNPRLQRFISEDALGLRAGPNVYGYANQNPASLTDPLGLESGTTYKLDYDNLNSGQLPPMFPFPPSPTEGRKPCSPPTSKFPTTIGVSAGGTAAVNGNNTTSILGSATTVVVSLNTGAVGLLANAGGQYVPSAAAPGGPEANGQFAGVGYQLVLSNGQPSQLLGTATSYQISAGLVIVGGTVAYSSYPNGAYKLSFTPWPGLPGAGGLGGFYKTNVPQPTVGFTTGCQ